MDARGRLHVLAHHVDRVGKELGCVQRAAPVPRLHPGVRRFAEELDLYLIQGRQPQVEDASVGHGVPVQRGVEVGEEPLAGHVDLGALGLLRGTPVDAQGAGNLVLGHDLLDGEGRPEEPRPEQVVPAAVPAGLAVLARLPARDCLVP